jgi:hypothetical protein
MPRPDLSPIADPSSHFYVDLALCQMRDEALVDSTFWQTQSNESVAAMDRLAMDPCYFLDRRGSAALTCSEILALDDDLGAPGQARVLATLWWGPGSRVSEARSSRRVLRRLYF